jgi:hypothetical protein
MDRLFFWLEQTSASVWIRESPAIYGFPGILVLHTVGMAFLVGTSFAIILRTLGMAPGLRPETFLRFVPLMWVGFGLNAASGLALLLAYPTKALTNPLFYAKLALIALALVGLRHLVRNVLRNPEFQQNPATARLRAMAGATFVCWVAAITAGRFLAYTYTRLLTSDFF